MCLVRNQDQQYTQPKEGRTCSQFSMNDMLAYGVLNFDTKTKNTGNCRGLLTDFQSFPVIQATQKINLQRICSRVGAFLESVLILAVMLHSVCCLEGEIMSVDLQLFQ